MNGWHRLWLLSCVLWWVAVYAFQAYVCSDSGLLMEDWCIGAAKPLFAWLLLPCVGVYILGGGVAWVRKGFS